MATYSATLSDIIEPPPEYYDSQVQQQLDQMMFRLDNKFQSAMGELDKAKEGLFKIKLFNKKLEHKISDADAERRETESKIDSLKARVGTLDDNATKFNNEKESLRTNLNESQIQVARLEERLAAAVSELDRMRDPANPDGNMTIKKHVMNEKKEIKRLKLEAEGERNMLAADMDIVKKKDIEIKMLEKELSEVNSMLKISEDERMKARKEEEEERETKDVMINDYTNLKQEQKTFEQRLKDARIKLGVALAGRNCNLKVVDDTKKHQKDLSKQLSQIEKKLKEATSDLDILKNQHKMSKTAMSINNYTKRNQLKLGSSSDKISVAQSGIGVKFATKVKNHQSLGNISTLSKQSNSEKRVSQSNVTSKINLNTNRSKDGAVANKTGANTDRSKEVANSDRISAHNTQLDKGNRIRKPIIGKVDRRNSVQLVPPPRAKFPIR